MLQKILFTTSGLLLFTLVSFSQVDTTRKANPEQLAKAQTAKMKSNLNLNESQGKSVYDINLKFVTATMELKKLTNKMDKFKGMKKATEERNEAMKKVLDEKQYEKFLEAQEERKEKMKEKMKERKKKNDN